MISRSCTLEDKIPAHHEPLCSNRRLNLIHPARTDGGSDRDNKTSLVLEIDSTAQPIM
jgi:hypothetical protein